MQGLCKGPRLFVLDNVDPVLFEELSQIAAEVLQDLVSDPAARGIPLPRIPNSDGAGEVLAVGADPDHGR